MITSHGQVGEVTEMTPLARCDLLFEKFANWTGVAFPCGPSPAGARLQQATIGPVAISQPLLHVGQRVLKVADTEKLFSDTGNDIEFKKNTHVTALEEIKASVQFLSLAGQVARSFKGISDMPEVVIRRAEAALHESRQRLGSGAATIVNAGTTITTNVLDNLETLKVSAPVATLVKLCTDGDFSEERVAEAMVSIQKPETVEYYKLFKKAQKAKVTIEAILATLTPMEERMSSVASVTTAKSNLVVLVERFDSDGYATLSNTMGTLVTAQTLWRPLNPGESRESLAQACTEQVKYLTLPAPLSLALTAATSKQRSEPVSNP